MSRVALLVIDFINDLVCENSKIAAAAQFIKENRTIEKVNQAIQIARQHNWLIIFVKVGFSTNYIECNEQSPLFGKIKQLEALRLSTQGTEFYDKLDIRSRDVILIKHRISTFYATALETILHSHKVDTILISGLSTNMAVYSAALEGHDRDYKVIIISDACAAANNQIHQQSLESLSRIAEIINVDEFEIKYQLA